VYLASYLAQAVASTDVDITTNQLVAVLASLQASDPVTES